MSVPLGIRSFKGSPYHYCGRCGTRVHINEMRWERGVLVCKIMNCQDTGEFPQVGQREMAIERVLNGIIDEEPKIDRKLIDPDVVSYGDDDISF